MTTHYRLSVDELSVDVLNSIKAAFKNKMIDIMVSEAIDETDYLLSTDANRENLNRAMQQVREGKIKEFTLEQFKSQFGS